MKLGLIVVTIFFMTFAFKGEARELNLKEKASIHNYIKSKNVRSFALERINTHQLSVSEFLSFKVLKNSCGPLEKNISLIKSQDRNYKDQSIRLGRLMDICSQSVVALTDIYIQQLAL